MDEFDHGDPTLNRQRRKAEQAGLAARFNARREDHIAKAADDLKHQRPGAPMLSPLAQKRGQKLLDPR
ncbi:MAG TPA: hypothetical protein VNQ99_16180 [Xanthobacteraceae bacterium]|nr:hypothetical protein [Xanthobacteraceae bacterium]